MKTAQKIPHRHIAGGGKGGLFVGSCGVFRFVSIHKSHQFVAGNGLLCQQIFGNFVQQSPVGGKDILHIAVATIQNVLHFTYVENRGAAFGILQDGRWFFIVITLIILTSLSVYIRRQTKRGKLFNVSICMIYAGAIGNFIDRLFKGYVVDMIHATFINFPVFNFADCLIVVGVILLYVYILFFDKVKTDERD